MMGNYIWLRMIFNLIAIQLMISINRDTEIQNKEKQLLIDSLSWDAIGNWEKFN